MTTPRLTSLWRGQVRKGWLAGAAAAFAAILVGVVLSASASAFGPYPALSPCSVFPQPPASLSPHAPSLPTEAAWNQDVSKAPRDPRSNAYIAYIDSHGGDHLHPDFGSPRAYGFPYSVVGRGVGQLPVHYTAYGDESDPGPFPTPPKAPVEGGNRSDGDRHVLVVDRSTCKLYELYRAFPDKKRNRWKAESGAIWDLRSAGLRREGWTSADAAGLPIFPGLVRYEEVAAGAVNHAIRITFAETREAYIRPATHCAGSTNDADVVAMGTRLRMKASFDISGITGQARPIAEAMKKYGFVVADNGSDWFFSGSSDSRFDDDNLNQLKEIPGSAFEVVATQDEAVTC